MTKGTVKWFDAARGYGAIGLDDDSNDALFYVLEMERAGLTSLAEGQRVQFDLQLSRNGKSSAENLMVLG